MVISGEYVCCTVVFGTLVGVFVFSVMWVDLLRIFYISCPLWSSVCECQRVECAFTTSPVRTECSMFVMCCMQCCSAWMCCLEEVHVCNCDTFSVVNVYLDHLKFCVVFIDGRKYVCCSECNVVSNECNEPTSRLVQHIGVHASEGMYFWCFCFKGELSFLNCDYICTCVVNNQFELYANLQYNEISLTFTAGSVCVC